LTCNLSGVLTTTLDPLPHLYTISSDDFESENNPSVANGDHNFEQGEFDFSESVSLPLITQGLIFTDSQHSGVRTPPWAPVYSERAPPTEDEVNMINAPSSPSATQLTPEQRSLVADSEPTINLDLPSPPRGLEVDADSSSLPSFVMGNEWCRHLKSGNRLYTLHPKINGDISFF
jgi:hypothetical protein